MARDLQPFTFRVHPADLTAWKRAAKRSGMTLSAWIRRACLAGLSFVEPEAVQIELTELLDKDAPLGRRARRPRQASVDTVATDDRGRCCVRADGGHGMRCELEYGHTGLHRIPHESSPGLFTYWSTLLDQVDA